MTVFSPKSARSPAPSIVLGSARRLLGPLFGIAWLVVALGPIYYLILGSLRNQADALSGSPWVPSHFTLANYQQALLQGGMLTATRNSVVVTVATALGSVLFGFAASYSIVRSKRRVLRSTLFRVFLFGLTVPLEGSVVSLFVLLNKIGLYNNLLGLILPQLAFNLPLAVVVLMSYLRDVPLEIYEALDLDGASEWKKITRVALPLARPALLGIVVFIALQAWNSFLLPLVLLQSAGVSVVPLGILRFETTYTVDTPGLLASVVISAVPLLVLYLVGRRHLLRGFTLAVGR